MSKQVSKMAVGNRMGCKVFVSCLCLIFSLALLIPSMAFGGSDRLIDDKEYQDKDFHKGIIADYTDMVKGDDVDWVWVKSGENLSQYKIKVGTMENKSDLHRKSFSESVKSIFEDYIPSRTKGSRDTLTAELCITEVQEYNPGKAWIPFAGGRLMQAGIGIEMVLRDQNNMIVAKLRHFDRHGSDVIRAAEDVADHMAKYISRH